MTWRSGASLALVLACTATANPQAVGRCATRRCLPAQGGSYGGSYGGAEAGAEQGGATAGSSGSEAGEGQGGQTYGGTAPRGGTGRGGALYAGATQGGSYGGAKAIAGAASGGVMRLRSTTLLFSLSLAGCSATFEEARLASPTRDEDAPIGIASAERAVSEERCSELSDREALFGALAKFGVGLSSSAALTAWPVNDAEDERALAIAAASVGAATLALEYYRSATATQWVEECTP